MPYLAFTYNNCSTIGDRFGKNIGVIPLYSTFQYTLGSHGMEFHYLLTWEIPVLFGIKFPCDVGNSLVSCDIAGTFGRGIVNSQIVPFKAKFEGYKL